MKKKKVPAGKHKQGGGKQGSWKQGGAKAASGSKENVFETLWTRRKFDVLGKKQKGGDAKRVGQARSAALDKRKKSLLQEYKQRGKTNAFLDHRFGEHDESLGDEDKAILRFQKERMVQMQKKSKFTLDDGDDDDDDEPTELLTHGGNALSSFDDFKDNISIEDDDDAGLNADIVRDLHFGGGFVGKKGGEDGDEEGKKRSKKEIMEEVIAKSKYFKAQKAKEKEEDHDLKEKLDADFTALAQSNGLLSLVRPKKVDALKSLLAKGATGDSGSAMKVLKAGDKTLEVKEKPDEYDKLVKEMGFEIRGHASDRSKTAEELAKEERTRLEELEKKRKQRMLGGAESDDDDDEDESDKDEEQSRRQQKMKKREISGDDLGENFVMEDEYQEKGWVDEVLARKDDSDEDDDEDEDDEDDEGSDDGSEDDEAGSEGSDDEDGSEESEDWEHSEDELEGISGIPKLSAKDQDLLDKLLAAKKGPKPEKEVRNLLEKESKVPQKLKKALSEVHELDNALPYVIDAPQTLLEFRQLVDKRSIEDLGIAVERIRKCNAISLAAENRKKMQVFYNVLLQYFATLAGERPLSMQRINSLVKPLIELSGESHYYAAVCARERIIRMQKQLSEKLQSTDDISCWPSNRTLLLFRLWSMIFPPSDFRHAVMTPAMLLMSEYLLRCPVKSGHDVAVGTFICSLLLSVMRPAKRFCPEALSFLQALLLSALPKMSRSKGLPDVALHCPSHLVEFVASKQWLQVSRASTVAADVQPLDFISLLTADSSATIFESDSFKVGILYSVMKTLSGFVEVYSNILSFPEVFSPFVSLLEALKKENVLPEALMTLTTEVHQLIAEKVKEHETLRQPLQMRMSKPTPIKTFNPQFEENYVKGRDYDPDRQRAETKKLKKQLKRDAKGAARELRKDNWFLADEKAKENAIAQQEREEKYNKAMSFLEQQESAFKSGQLGKGRKRKKR
ncbi:hypothetical protein KC19_1G034800 [Ceratodon purpureus]|uniref:Nucleolar protein 14 n=1 Tax=Ceratodon purpureus TaxID=3225 RepID=A0A8T0J3Y6_CERPU|nr:hypothetical protein KC19_1G034800 [Ceratodon purpureus]